MDANILPHGNGNRDSTNTHEYTGPTFGHAHIELHGPAANHEHANHNPDAYEHSFANNNANSNYHSYTTLRKSALIYA